MDVHLDTRSDGKSVFGFPVLCKGIRKGKRKAPIQGYDEGEKKGLREISRPICRDLSGKNRAASHVY